MSTHELFKKHFGGVCAVDLKHPNMEAFFEELNKERLEEIRQEKEVTNPLNKHYENN